MLSALRKMGNSTGLIVPKAVLREAGLASGAKLDLVVENGNIVLRPVKEHPRAGWAEDAALVAAAPEDPDEVAWRGFANIGDTDESW